jgi:hypothetical protein
MTQYAAYHPEKIYGGREEVLSYLTGLKGKNTMFTVLDVGAAWNPFSTDFVTHTLDFNPIDLPGVTSFSGDVNDHETWESLIAYTEEHGKFDFCNCTHILEDLAYPVTALKYMPRIAKEGFIAVPSVFWELQRRQEFRGGVHHRWIHTYRDDKLILYPKINLIDSLFFDEEHIARNAHLELRMFWKDTIDFEIINGDYLGPSYEAVVDMYVNIMN